MTQSKSEKFKSDYKNMVQAIFRFLYYKCGDRDLAQDLTQDAFVKYWEKIDSIKAGGESPYLYQIARNLLINKSQRDKVALKFRQTIHIPTDNQSPQFMLEEKEFRGRVEQAISELPENQREVFLMNRIDQLKYKEIADVLNLSQKAVEKRMSLALKKLREIHKNI